MQTLRKLSAFLVMLLIARAVAGADEGFKPIFDGKTLQRLGRRFQVLARRGRRDHRPDDRRQSRPGQHILDLARRPAGRFRVETRIPHARPGFANSGVQYRSREEPKKVGRWVVAGYQADMDGENQYTGILYDERGRGILAMRGQKTVVGDDHRAKVVE